MEKMADFTMEQIIYLILVLIIVGIIAFFIFNDKILSYIRVLPGYEIPETDEIIDVDNQTRDVIGEAEIDCFARFGEEEKRDCLFKEQYIYFDETRSSFFISNYANGQGQIKLCKPGFSRNIIAANIKNNKIKVVLIPLEANEMNQLAKLNNAEIKYNNLICK